MVCAYYTECYRLQTAFLFFSKIFLSKAAIVSAIAIDITYPAFVSSVEAWVWSFMRWTWIWRLKWSKKIVAVQIQADVSLPGWADIIWLIKTPAPDFIVRVSTNGTCFAILHSLAAPWVTMGLPKRAGCAMRMMVLQLGEATRDLQERIITLAVRRRGCHQVVWNGRWALVWYSDGTPFTPSIWKHCLQRHSRRKWTRK